MLLSLDTKETKRRRFVFHANVTALVTSGSESDAFLLRFFVFFDDMGMVTQPEALSPYASPWCKNFAGFTPVSPRYWRGAGVLVS